MVIGTLTVTSSEESAATTEVSTKSGGASSSKPMVVNLVGKTVGSREAVMPGKAVLE